MKKIVLIAVVCFTLVSLIHAQTAKDQTPQQPERPKFTAALAKLSFLAGTFDVTLTQYESPMAKAGTGNGHNTTHWDLDSLFLIMDHEDESPNGHYKGHGVFSYDAPSKQYTCWWFNNWGGTTEYKGDFVGDTLELAAEVQSPNGIMPMKLLWYPDGKRVGFKIFSEMGKGEMLLMESINTPVKKGPTGIRKH